MDLDNRSTIRFPKTPWKVVSITWMIVVAAKFLLPEKIVNVIYKDGAIAIATCALLALYGIGVVLWSTSKTRMLNDKITREMKGAPYWKVQEIKNGEDYLILLEYAKQFAKWGIFLLVISFAATFVCAS